MSDLRYLMEQIQMLELAELRRQIQMLELAELRRLRDLLNERLGDEPDPGVGVREPRRPKPESGEGAVALVEDDEQ